MIAILLVTLLMAIGCGRLPNLALALICIVTLVTLEPALVEAHWGAYLAALSVMFAALQCLRSAPMTQRQPVRVLWKMPRLTVAIAFA